MFDLPPSTPIICPVIQELFSVSKKFAKLAESMPCPILFNGCILAIDSSIVEFLITVLAIFDLVKLGAIQFILICVFFLLYDIELVFLLPYVSAITFVGLYDLLLITFFFVIFFLSLIIDFNRHALL